MARGGRQLVRGLLLLAFVAAAAGCPSGPRSGDPFLFSGASPRAPEAPAVPPAPANARAETPGGNMAPTVSLTVNGPASVPVGQEIEYGLTIHNASPTPLHALMVRCSVPEGLRHVRSEPPADLDAGQLVWTLGALDGASDRTLQAVFQASEAGSANFLASLVTDDGRRDEKTTALTVAPPPVPGLQVNMTGPRTGVVGVPLTCQIAAKNPGTGPASNVQLKAEFTPTLEHASQSNPVELPLGTLAPGESRTVALPLRVAKAGPAVVRVTATAEGGYYSGADHSLTAMEAKLALKLSGPAVRYVGRSAVWDLEVSNGGSVPLTQVVVRDLLPPELTYASASTGGRLQEGPRGQPGGSTIHEVAWDVGSLRPGEAKHLQLTTTPGRMAPQARNVALASALPEGETAASARIQTTAEAALAIQGLPAFKLDVKDLDDPVEVGGRTSYRITVTNTGSLPGNQVQIVALLPPQMRLLSASGRSPYRSDGPRVVFEPLPSLEQGQAVTCTIEVEAVQAGDARFRAELTSTTLREPIAKEESTNVIGGGSSAPSPGK
jgi:uncharacterized repeat protein (TIGR01451 family)